MKLICPICNKELKKKEKSYYCENNHCFDVAKEGYINLLPVNKKKSFSPGDNKDMITARRSVMNNGYYLELAGKLKEIINKYPHKNIIDVGCGEGYLTRAIKDIDAEIIGIDISKDAVKYSQARDKGNTYLVASVNELPIENNCADIILNCFAPINEKEFARVLKKDGILIKVTPSETHLLELKEALYDKIYLNEEKSQIEGFSLQKSIVLRVKKLFVNDEILSLIQMTPYYYTTKKKRVEEIVKEYSEKNLEVTLSFNIRLFTKETNN